MRIPGTDQGNLRPSLLPFLGKKPIEIYLCSVRMRGLAKKGYSAKTRGISIRHGELSLEAFHMFSYPTFSKISYLLRADCHGERISPPKQPFGDLAAIPGKYHLLLGEELAHKVLTVVGRQNRKGVDS